MNADDIVYDQIARYILSTQDRMLAYPSSEALAVIVCNYNPKILQPIQEHLGLTVQACNQADSSALSFSIQQLLLFLLYHMLLTLGNYRAFNSGYGQEDGLSLLNNQQSTNRIIRSIRLHSCVLNSQGSRYTTSHQDCNALCSAFMC